MPAFASRSHDPATLCFLYVSVSACLLSPRHHRAVSRSISSPSITIALRSTQFWSSFFLATVTPARTSTIHPLRVLRDVCRLRSSHFQYSAPYAAVAKSAHYANPALDLPVRRMDASLHLVLLAMAVTLSSFISSAFSRLQSTIGGDAAGTATLTFEPFLMFVAESLCGFVWFMWKRPNSPASSGIGSLNAANGNAPSSKSGATDWSWGVLIGWGVLLSMMDLFATTMPEGISYSGEFTFGGVYLLVVAGCTIFMYSIWNKHDAAAGGADGAAAPRLHRFALQRWQWTCLLMSAAGSALYAASGEFFDPVDPSSSLGSFCRPEYNCGWGVILAIFRCLMNGSLTVLQEFVLRRYEWHPMFLVGLEGVCGLIILSLFFVFTSVGMPEFFLTEGLNELSLLVSNPLWWITNAGYILNLMVLNTSLMQIIALSGGLFRAIVQPVPRALSWTANVLVGWSQYSFRDSPGYLLVTGAAVLYWRLSFTDAEARVIVQPAHPPGATVSVTVTSVEAAPAAANGDMHIPLLATAHAAASADEKSDSQIPVVVLPTAVTVEPAAAAAAAVASNDSSAAAPLLGGDGKPYARQYSSGWAATPVPTSGGVAWYVVVLGSFGYFVYLLVLCVQTNALPKYDGAGAIILFTAIVGIASGRYVWRRILARLGITAGLGLSSLVPPAVTPSTSIHIGSAPVPWIEQFFYSLVYLGPWLVLAPCFGILNQQMIYAVPEPLPSSPDSDVVLNTLRAFSILVLAWMVLPTGGDFTLVYARRELLTRVVLDLVDGLNLVDPQYLSVLNVDSAYDRTLIDSSILFGGLTLCFVAITGAVSGLRTDELTMFQPNASSSEREVRLFWLLLPYTVSIVFNNFPFLIIRVVLWAHTRSVTLALLGKNVLGLVLCIFFIGSTLKSEYAKSAPAGVTRSAAAVASA